MVLAATHVTHLASRLTNLSRRERRRRRRLRVAHAELTGFTVAPGEDLTVENVEIAVDVGRRDDHARGLATARRDDGGGVPHAARHAQNDATVGGKGVQNARRALTLAITVPEGVKRPFTPGVTRAGFGDARRVTRPARDLNHLDPRER